MFIINSAFKWVFDITYDFVIAAKAKMMAIEFMF